MKTILRTGVVLLLLLAATLLPFLPGRHDVLAIPLSTVAQGLGFAALLVVPVGVLWLVHGLRHRGDTAAADLVRARYALAALAVATALALLAAMLTVTQAGISAGAAMVVGTLLAAGYFWRLSRRRSFSQPGPDRVTPACCVLAPPLLLGAQLAIAPTATAFARDRAIANAAPLIADIERFRAQHGRYPHTLHSLWEDYDPLVVGIPRYLYEPHGEACNLFFETPTFEFGARVIVVWNPRDEQTATSHNRDLLEFTGADLERRRGFLAAHAAPQPHWKWFVFD
ncbi:MAG: hypothetical protein WAT39_05455 [Planctomycetota bacterium]